MYQERKIMDEDAIAESMKQLERTGKYSEEELHQVRDDYKYGLTREEVELYLRKNFSVKQMQMISRAIREHGVELAKVIAKDDLDHHCMRVAIEFYEKGVPLAAIAESVVEKQNAHALRYLYQKILADIKQVEDIGLEENKNIDTNYLEQMLEEMKKIALQISHDDKKFDALSEKIKEMGNQKISDKEFEEYHKRLEEKDILINSQQDNIQQANATIARLRAEIEGKDKEMKKLNDRNVGLETELENKKAESNTGNKHKDVNLESEEVKPSFGSMQTQYPLVYGIPVEYAASMKNGKNGASAFMTIEKSTPKQTGLYALIGKLAYKKKSRQDIVKLVANGNLKTEQLMQIRIAIQKGLTESQLLDLINNNVAAEQMKEIIEIAVLENSMQ